MPKGDGTVLITRMQRGWRFFEAMTIEIDGQVVGKLRQRRTGTYRGSPGSHSVQTKYRVTTKSDPLMIQVDEGSAIRLECTHDRVGYPILRTAAP